MDPKSVLLGLREKSVGLSKAQTRIPWREIINWQQLSQKGGAKQTREAKNDYEGGREMRTIFTEFFIVMDKGLER